MPAHAITTSALSTHIWSTRLILCCLAVGAAASIGEQYPFLADSGVLDVLFPKKDPVFVAKT
jgi:hypothetical protein